MWPSGSTDQVVVAGERYNCYFLGNHQDSRRAICIESLQGDYSLLGQEALLVELLGRELLLDLRKFRGVHDPEPPQDGVKVEFKGATPF